MTNGYWWCAECYEEVDCHRVTSQELHDTCGRPVVWVETKEPIALLRHQIAALQAENVEKDREIERLQLQRPVQVDGDVMAMALELAETKATLTRAEVERDKAVEENEFRKHTVLTPLYTCGGHGYSDDDDEDFWCPICRQHLGTHRGFETTCKRCGQEINSDGEPCWDYDELRRTEYDHLPKNWDRGAQGEG